MKKNCFIRPDALAEEVIKAQGDEKVEEKKGGVYLITQPIQKRSEDLYSSDSDLFPTFL